ncbi:protein GLUTAMINE DUMPER 5 [Zea mays]|jgi:hypothetical protein|uniref:Protein GLUTAMINE DUMPER 5 n=1 Tax=Zea mays TaxID=4577 RepID=K7VJR7_MAIZE|nr:protein GLUTAMINE DUMPER 5 [Zea mays]AQL05193.1 Protein GLUTAMINE DUMPER 5 [Zea mays]|eukprot:XP_008659881.1 protein GLUTAMINE DUMPER 5 [Zea mays]
MRPAAEFPTMSHGAPMGANANVPHSPWQSPVPYLFGGLAAMLGLIALALLILACSYWKLSGYLDADRGQRAGSSGEAGADGEKGSAAGAARPAAGFQEHVVVIMAGEERPTFLATPAASRAVVELGAAPGSGGSAEAPEEEEAHVDGDGGCGDCEHEVPRLGADAGTVSRSSEGTSSATTALAE